MTTNDSDLDRQQLALELGVRWAGSDMNRGYDEAVKAADSFELFLAGEQQRLLLSLDELCAKVEWDDDHWRRSFLRTLVDGIVSGLSSPSMLETIGGFQTLGWQERSTIKGVNGLDSLWLAADQNFEGASERAAFAPHIDQGHCESNIFEIPASFTVEFTAATHEDEVQSVPLRTFIQTKVVDGIAAIDEQVLAAVDSLLSVAGFKADGGRRWSEVPPFRVEFACFGGWRGKEWTEEGGEYWHLWLKTTLGGAVFKVPE